jgi:hypothetical protein
MPHGWPPASLGTPGDAPRERAQAELDAPSTPSAWDARLRALDARAQQLAERAQGGEALVWAEAMRASIASHARDLTLMQSPEGWAGLRVRLERVAGIADTLVAGMDFRSLFDTQRAPLLARLSRRRGRARPGLLRPARLRGVSHQLRRRSPRGTRRSRTGSVWGGR